MAHAISDISLQGKFKAFDLDLITLDLLKPRIRFLFSAKSLLIVIGDPHLLAGDDSW